MCTMRAMPEQRCHYSQSALHENEERDIAEIERCASIYRETDGGVYGRWRGESTEDEKQMRDGHAANGERRV